MQHLGNIGGRVKNFQKHGEFEVRSEWRPAIRIGEWKPAELQRLEAVMDFPYAKEWNGVYYATKRVRPIFVEETTETHEAGNNQSN